ncbi:hypothetical protein PybrP1_009599 [[Pythium] brassicae (nom. inval.)]|nr:hypothetical protein PybrP1_009599 [[Pythium] brassicae (nom. inval.)]
MVGQRAPLRLGLERPVHEQVLELLALDLALDHRVDSAEDGQVEPALVRKVDSDLGGRHALDGRRLEDILRLLAADHAHAERPVAREAPERREHEVADAREPGDRDRLPAHRDAELLQLERAARDVGRERVDAKARALDHAGADRERVLERAAELHADDVLRAVDAKVDGRERALHEHRVVEVLAGDDHRGRRVRHELGRERWAGEERERLVAPERLEDRERQQLLRLEVQPLARDDEHRGRGDVVPVQREEGRRELRRQAHDHHLGVPRGVLHARRGRDRRQQLVVREHLWVAVARVDGVHLLAAVAENGAERHVSTACTETHVTRRRTVSWSRA